ncbi:MAG: hypothetical protein IPK03_13180 [Bacteroidetes bacterium]|nr:hypothetical protein [Bacteroidota bacterium]
MHQLKENFQVIYYAPINSLGVAMNLISFGYLQFKNNTKIKEIELLKRLCFGTKEFSKNDVNSALELFVSNNLIDSIRIIICFENYMKAEYFAQGYLIHRLNKEKFKDLAKEQNKRPVLLSEVLELSKWEINSTLKTFKESTRYQIKGILTNTIGMKELLSVGYLTKINFPEDIANICKDYNTYRNNLHLYMEENMTLSEESFYELTKLTDFVNNKIVSLHNTIVDKIGKGEQYKIETIKYFA